MNQAIKLNPSFSNAVLDRGIANYDKREYDRSTEAADAVINAKPTFAVKFSGRGNFENRREGDRIIQDASQPIRNNQYNAYAYSPDTFPPASPPVIAPQSVAVPAPRSKPPPQKRRGAYYRRCRRKPTMFRCR